MTLKIVTDSTCDLPAALIAAHDVTVVPLYINIGPDSYQDGIELSRADFYTRLPGFDPPPTTSAPGPARFHQVYRALAAKGATAILSIHVAASLSATCHNAQIAAQEFSAIPVTVFDSQQLSLGTGLQVLAAAKAAAQGQPAGQIVTQLESMARRTHTWAALDTLDYLRRSGRVNALVAGLGTMLQIKPLLKMHYGEPTSERVRTRKRAIQRLIELLQSVGPLEQAALIHTNAPELVAQLRAWAAHLLPTAEPLAVNATPVIGAHIGPGAVGFVAVSASGSQE